MEKIQGTQDILLRRISSNFLSVVRAFGVGDHPSMIGVSIDDLGLGNMYTQVVKGVYTYKLETGSQEESERKLSFLAKYSLPRDRNRPKNLYQDRHSIRTQEEKGLSLVRGIPYFIQPVYVRRMKDIRLFPYVGEETLEARLETQTKEQKKETLFEVLTHLRKAHDSMNKKFTRLLTKSHRIPDFLRHGKEIGINSSLDYLRAILKLKRIEDLPENVREAWPRAYRPIAECFEDSLEIAHGDMHSVNVLYGSNKYQDKIFFLGPKLTLIDQWFDVDSLLASHGLGFNPEDREEIIERLILNEGSQEFTPRERRFLGKIFEAVKLSPDTIQLAESARRIYCSHHHRRVIDRSLRKLGKNADVRTLSPYTWQSWLAKRPGSFTSCDSDARATVQSTLTTLIQNPETYRLDSERKDNLLEMEEILHSLNILNPENKSQKEI